MIHFQRTRHWWEPAPGAGPVTAFAYRALPADGRQWRHLGLTVSLGAIAVGAGAWLGGASGGARVLAITLFLAGHLGLLATLTFTSWGPDAEALLAAPEQVEAESDTADVAPEAADVAASDGSDSSDDSGHPAAGAGEAGQVPGGETADASQAGQAEPVAAAQPGGKG